MKKTGFIILLLMSPSVYAETLSQSIFPAGKTIIPRILDSSNSDVTKQFHFLAIPAAAGPGLKMSSFAGKTIIVGSIAGDYTLQATKDSDQSLQTFPVSVTAGAASSIAILDGDIQSVPVGSSPSPLKVKVVDFFGNPVSGASVNFSITSGSGSVSPSSISDVSGIAQGILNLGTKAERNVVKASMASSGLSKSVSFSVNSIFQTASATKLSIASQPKKSTLGSVFSPVVVNTVNSVGLPTSYSGDISVASFKNNTCTVASTLPILGTAKRGYDGYGTHATTTVTFSDLESQSAEPIFLKFSGDGVASVCSQVISVSPRSQGLASLKFTQLPTLLAAGRNLFPAVKVAELDSNNEPVSGSDQIQIAAFTDAACSKPAVSQFTNSEMSASGGLATFAKMQTTEAQTIYLKASVGLTSACSPALSISGTTTACPAGFQVTANACAPTAKSEQLIKVVDYNYPQLVYYFSPYDARQDANFITTTGHDAILTKIEIGLALAYLPSNYTNGNIFLTVRDNDSGAIVATSSVIHPKDGLFTKSIANIGPFDRAAALTQEQIITFTFDQSQPVTILDNKYYTVWVHNIGTDNQIWRFSNFNVYGIQ